MIFGLRKWDVFVMSGPMLTAGRCRRVYSLVLGAISAQSGHEVAADRRPRTRAALTVPPFETNAHAHDHKGGIIILPCPADEKRRTAPTQISVPSTEGKDFLLSSLIETSKGCIKIL